MQWDNYGLPIKDHGYLGESAKDLAVYFINVLCFKKQFDLTFKDQHPQRAREASEPVEEYNNYLTQHLHAYRELLSKNNIQYMQDSDVHLYDKVSSLLYSDNQLRIHPQLGNTMNMYNLVPMLVCLSLYGFGDIVNAQTSNHPIIKSIKQQRSNVLTRTLADLYCLFKAVFIDVPEVSLSYMVYAKLHHPTKISEWTQRIFFTKCKYYGNIQTDTVAWLLR